jgi:hypothetical protein
MQGALSSTGRNRLWSPVKVSIILVSMLERVTAWNRLFRPGTTLIVKFE